MWTLWPRVNPSPLPAGVNMTVRLTAFPWVLTLVVAMASGCPDTKESDDDDTGGTQTTSSGGATSGTVTSGATSGTVVSSSAGTVTSGATSSTPASSSGTAATSGTSTATSRNTAGPSCNPPSTPPSAGTCIPMGEVFTCNPVTNEGCDTAANWACDYHKEEKVFRCFEPPNLPGACQQCPNYICAPGYGCHSSKVCAKYCCTDEDCGADGTCDFGWGSGNPPGLCLKKN